MRSAFFRVLLDRAELDPTVELVVGDLGFGAVEEFVRRHPERFLNVGVAEQNMIGVAAGLALTGSKVFVYSIANFPTFRCLEQIRNDVCYHGADVKIVTVGGGFNYGTLGASHHTTEDLAIMRVLPEMAVAAPGDPFEAAAITHEVATLRGPAYLRLDRAGATVHDLQPCLPPGTSIVVSHGNDVALLVTGGLLPEAVRAGEKLSAQGISTRVVSMPWLDPIDRNAIADAARTTALVVTLEEHAVAGGLGSAVAEVIAEEAFPAPLLRIGLPPQFNCLVGSQDYLRRAHGLDAESVVDRVKQRLGSHLGARTR